MKMQNVLISLILVWFTCISFPVILHAAEYVYVSNEDDDTVSVIDTSSNTVIDTISVGDRPKGITADPSGSRVYVANQNDNTLSVIDTSTNTIMTTIAVGTEPGGVDGIAISPDGSFVYVVNNYEDNLSVIDTTNNHVNAAIPVGDEPWGVAVNPSGKYVYATNDMDGTVSVIDTSSNTVIHTIQVGSGPTGIAVNPTGTKVFVAGEDETDYSVSVLDTATCSVTRTIPAVGSTGIAVDPSGTEVWTGKDEKTIAIIDSTSYTVIDSITTVEGFDCIAFNHSGSRAYVNHEYDNSVSVIDTADRTVIKTIPVGRAPFWMAVVQDSDPVDNVDAQDGGYEVGSDLWLKAVLQVPGSPITLIWKEVGTSITPSGDTVISGYFYADPADFAYGNIYNPEAFVKIYIASSGWANMAFNHVTVDNISIYSAHHYSGSANQSDLATLDNRLIEHAYTGVTP